VSKESRRLFLPRISSLNLADFPNGTIAVLESVMSMKILKVQKINKFGAEYFGESFLKNRETGDQNTKPVEEPRRDRRRRLIV
jgi:hypothetical protein